MEEKERGMNRKEEGRNRALGKSFPRPCPPSPPFYCETVNLLPDFSGEILFIAGCRLTSII
jgi:hypothetical protein